MSLISIHALTAPAQAALGPASAPSADAQGFESMLGRMSQKSSSPASCAATATGKDPNANSDNSAAPESTTLSALQSLEAALASIATPVAPAAAPTSEPSGANAATPLGTALDQAAGALGDAAATGQLTIKGMLQADPSLGLTDVQMRTFLGVAGATPVRAGATTLLADAAWSPLAPSLDAEATPAAGKTAPPLPVSPGAGAPASTTLNAGNAMASAPAARVVAPSAPPSSPLEAAAVPVTPAAAAPAAPARKPVSGVSALASAASHSASNAVASPTQADAVASTDPTSALSGSEGDASADAGTDATAATDATAPDSAAGTSFTVALADLPAFLSGQASSLSPAETPDAPAGSAATTPAGAKAAQAVKELNISLNPADLGEITVKLRLANGKLSVSIAVANPSTLGAIQDDRDLIAARLSGGDQALEDLVISRQGPTNQEVQTANASNDNGASADDNPSDPDGSERPPSRGGAGGGGFGDLLV